MTLWERHFIDMNGKILSYPFSVMSFSKTIICILQHDFLSTKWHKVISSVKWVDLKKNIKKMIVEEYRRCLCINNHLLWVPTTWQTLFWCQRIQGTKHKNLGTPEDPNKNFTKEVVQMASKHRKVCSALLGSWER